MFRFMRTFSVVLFVLGILLSTGVTPARAADPLIQWTSLISATCDGFGWTITVDDVIDLPAGSEVVVDFTRSGTPSGFDYPIVTGPMSTSGGAVYYLNYGADYGSTFTFTVNYKARAGGVVYSGVQVNGSCTAGVASVSYANYSNSVSAPSEPRFEGPGLPTDAEMIVFVADTLVFSTPEGTGTGQVMKTCQTAFVLETSADGKWYRIFVMGGWVPASKAVKVARDYDQPGGTSRIPGC